jgi:RNA-binding protein PNO1
MSHQHYHLTRPSYAIHPPRTQPQETKMPAPTALQRRSEELADNVAEDDITMEASAVPLPADDDAELVDMSIEPTSTPAPTEAAQAPTEDTPMTDETGRPKFPPAKSIPLAFRRDQRKVPIPPHRMTPLKAAWPKIFPPLVEHLQLQVRMNLKSKAVELRTSSSTTDTGALQKGQDFLQAFCLGFDVDDAIALLRLDDLYIQSFEVRDVKSLSGEHLGRAIGRIAGTYITTPWQSQLLTCTSGKDGKTRYAIASPLTPFKIYNADSM